MGLSPQGLVPRAYHPPALSWVEVQLGAGHHRGSWWGAFVAWRRLPDGIEEALAEARRLIAGEWPGPTPPEGVAAMHAFRWLNEADRKGLLRPYEPVVVAIDNAVVDSKVGNGNVRGAHHQVWAELARVTVALRHDPRFRVVQADMCSSRAHGLAVPHDNPEVWRVEGK